MDIVDCLTNFYSWLNRIEELRKYMKEDGNKKIDIESERDLWKFIYSEPNIYKNSLIADDETGELTAVWDSNLNGNEINITFKGNGICEYYIFMDTEKMIDKNLNSFIFGYETFEVTKNQIKSTGLWKELVTG